MSAPLLRVRNLEIAFDTKEGQRKVVDRVSFSVDQGEVLGIIGESGSGKTLSAMAILGLIADGPGVIGGEIELWDQDKPIQLLAGLEQTLKQTKSGVQKNLNAWQKLVFSRMKPLYGRVVTAIFQNPRQSLDPLLRIGPQIEESIALAHPQLMRAELKSQALDWLARVQMSDPARTYRSYPHELSGGMCQRAMIAVALARSPKLLIADEPTTGLDTTVRAEIVSLFRTLLSENETSMLYISHDIREVLYLAENAVVMRKGELLESTTSEALQKCQTKHAYTAELLAASGITAEGEAHG